MAGVQYAVTITREFGSMGRPIAKAAAAKLGVEVYDRDIVEAAAKKMGMQVSDVSNEEESARNSFFSMKYPLGMGTTKVQDQIFKVQRQIITELAEKESCFLVGRCSDFILQDNPNAVHVYIYASFEAKLRNCVELLHMKESEARKMITDVDKARAAYHLHYAGYAMDDKKHKNLIIDSSLLGVEGTADLLVNIVKEKFL